MYLKINEFSFESDGSVIFWSLVVMILTVGGAVGNVDGLYVKVGMECIKSMDDMIISDDDEIYIFMSDCVSNAANPQNCCNTVHDDDEYEMMVESFGVVIRVKVNGKSLVYPLVNCGGFMGL